MRFGFIHKKVGRLRFQIEQNSLSVLNVGMIPDQKLVKHVYELDSHFEAETIRLCYEEKELEGHIFRCHEFSEKILTIRFLSYRNELFQGVSLFQTYHPIFRKRPTIKKLGLSIESADKEMGRRGVGEIGQTSEKRFQT